MGTRTWASAMYGCVRPISEHLDLEYSGYEEYSEYFVYNFAPVTTSDNVLIGIRIKDCRHGFGADQYQSDFFRIFSQQNGDLRAYDSEISRDNDMGVLLIPAIIMCGGPLGRSEWGGTAAVFRRALGTLTTATVCRTRP